MEHKIEELIAKMSLEEKIGQLNQESIIADNERIEELKDLARQGKLGSCILAANGLAGDCEQEQFLIGELNELQRCAVEESPLGIPLIYGRDIIHGCRTIFPIPLAQAATWDYDLIRDAASIMSREASYDGVHWTFAPMLDICTDPRWGRIIECPGEDPLLGKMVAKASVDGIQGEDMSQPGKLAACAKHYIGYGASQAGRDKDPTEWSDYTMHNRALPAFEEAVDAGIATVMSAFNDISGQPATANKYYLTDVLRGKLGFDGYVVSDWAAIERLNCQGVSDNDLLSAALAINAGVDMDMFDGIYKNNLEQALIQGAVNMETIDEAVRRILRIKFRLGLFDRPYTEDVNTTGRVLTKEYLQKAKEMSAHSMVLLKNNGVLPLKKGEKVAVSGPYAEEKESLMGSWHASGEAKDVVSFFEGVQQVNGIENTLSDCNLAEQSDVCLVALGEDWMITGEGKTMPNIELPEEQVAAIQQAKKLGKKVVAVFLAGRPLAFGDIVEECDAILWAWHGGTMCGLAAAEILFGDFNPCGKLPVTFPRYTGQIPIHYNHNRNEYVLSGYYEHHPYVSTVGDSTPLYAFGEGLSYTEFVYDNFRCNKTDTAFEITFDIHNKGKFDGFEIAQCYIQDVVASMARPIKELKAFQKIYIKQGETKTVTMRLTREDLSFYDGRGNKVFEPGDFKLEIGTSSRHSCFTITEYLDFR
ncbi:MAG: glycoside hydrolase family 3 C-terminal domain-containing protein [Clostridia bacterium]|nr:glycoside hydrolase family 3 C-terminal domain-containing protein [Clostridia bacterium]